MRYCSMSSASTAPSYAAQHSASPAGCVSRPEAKPRSSGAAGDVVCGPVTMVTVEGGAVTGQLERLHEEIARLKTDKVTHKRSNDPIMPACALMYEREQ